MKIISSILAVTLICALISGCNGQNMSSQAGNCADGNEESNKALAGNIPVDFPLVSEPQDLNILITGYNGRDQENVFVWQEYEKMTGVNVNWTTVSKDERAEAVHSALTIGKNIDLTAIIFLNSPIMVSECRLNS